MELEQLQDQSSERYFWGLSRHISVFKQKSPLQNRWKHTMIWLISEAGIEDEEKELAREFQVRLINKAKEVATHTVKKKQTKMFEF